MKCQILFSGKNKKNISKCCLMKTLRRVQSVKLLNLFVSVSVFFKGNGYTSKDFGTILQKEAICRQEIGSCTTTPS